MTAIVRLTYRGRATPLWGHVPPGNKWWVNQSLPKPARSIERAKQLLRKEGFSWKADGTLIDDQGQPVEFTILTNSGNAERMQIATIIQDDLKQLGMRVGVVPLAQSALLDRVLTTHDYDACVLGLTGGDGDPNSEMNRLAVERRDPPVASGTDAKPATPWEAEIDTLMQEQIKTRDAGRRKRLYDRVQQLVAENLPIISLVSPNVLVGATTGLGNFRPTVLDHPALWNVEELFWRGRRTGAPAVNGPKTAATTVRQAGCHVDRCAAGSRVSRRQRAGLDDADRQVQELDLLDSVEVRRAAARRRGHFSVGLPRVVQRAAAAAQHRGVTRAGSSG